MSSRLLRRLGEERFQVKSHSPLSQPGSSMARNSKFSSKSSSKTSKSSASTISIYLDKDDSEKQNSSPEETIEDEQSEKDQVRGTKNAFQLLAENVSGASGSENEQESETLGSQAKAANAKTGVEAQCPSENKSNPEEGEETACKSATKEKPKKTKKNKRQRFRDRKKTTDVEQLSNKPFDQNLIWDLEEPSAELEKANSTQNEAKKRFNQQRAIMIINQRLLQPQYEISKRFGIAIAKESERGRISTQTNEFQHLHLVRPKLNWPVISRNGISMVATNTLHLESGDKITEFEFKHSTNYQKVQQAFWEGVESFDPQNVVDLFQKYPYHADTLLQLSDLVRFGDDAASASDLLERAIFVHEFALLNQCSICSSAAPLCRIRYSVRENRAFFLALYRHIHTLAQKSFYRTALELLKVLYWFDPEEEPLGVLLLIDLIALRAREYRWLLDFYEAFEPDRQLSLLPNWAYSIAFAKYKLAKEAELSRNRKLRTSTNPTSLFSIPSGLNINVGKGSGFGSGSSSLSSSRNTLSTTLGNVAPSGPASGASSKAGRRSGKVSEQGTEEPETLMSEADRSLQDALLLFPGVLFQLLDKSSIKPDAAVSKCSYFNEKTKEASLLALEALYVGRTFSLWKEGANGGALSEFLDHNVATLVTQLADRAIPKAKLKRITECRAVYANPPPQNVLRHVVLSDVKEAVGALGQYVANVVVLNHDPIPPSKSTESYERQRRTHSERQASNIFELFFRSIFPAEENDRNRNQMPQAFVPEGVAALGQRGLLNLLQFLPGNANQNQNADEAQGAVGGAPAAGNANLQRATQVLARLLQGIRNAEPQPSTEGAAESASAPRGTGAEGGASASNQNANTLGAQVQSTSNATDATGDPSDPAQGISLRALLSEPSPRARISREEEWIEVDEEIRLRTLDSDEELE